MNNLDQFIEYLAAGVFVCIGCVRVAGYRRRPKTPDAQSMRLPFGAPRQLSVAIGVLEIAAALMLAVPASLLPALAPLAVTFLALLTISAAIYQMRRHETPVPNIALFLLVLLVAVGRWM